MKAKKLILIILLTNFIVASGMFIAAKSVQADKLDDGAVVEKVFRDTGAKFILLNASQWAVVDKPILNKEDAIIYFKEQMGKLFPLNSNHMEVKCERNYIQIKAEGAISQQYYARLSLQIKDVTNPVSSKYIILSIHTHNPKSSYKVLKNLMNAFFYKMKGHESYVISGYLSGSRSPLEMNEKINAIIKSSNVQNVETLVNTNLVSISGYIPHVHQRLTIGKKSVNINIAFRNNSVEDKTYVYVGSPLITTEY